MCLLPRAHWNFFSWHSYSKIPSSSQPWMNVMDNFSESHVLAACDCFSILLAAAAQSGPPAARRLPPTQTRLTLFMGRRIFYHRLRDRCGGRLGGSKLNLLWVVGPGYCFGLTPAYLSSKTVWLPTKGQEIEEILVPLILQKCNEIYLNSALTWSNQKK